MPVMLCWFGGSRLTTAGFVEFRVWSGRILSKISLDSQLENKYSVLFVISSLFDEF